MTPKRQWYDYDEQSALIGIHHVGYTGAITEEEIDGRSLQMLARALNIRNLVAFIGSGLSRPYGHLTWDEFTKEVVEGTIKAIGTRDGFISDEEKQLLDRFRDDVDCRMEKTSSRVSRSEHWAIMNLGTQPPRG